MDLQYKIDFEQQIPEAFYIEKKSGKKNRNIGRKKFYNNDLFIIVRELAI